MSHLLKSLPLNYNEFHVLSATPWDTECNMKKLPDKAEIVKSYLHANSIVAHYARTARRRRLPLRSRRRSR